MRPQPPRLNRLQRADLLVRGLQRQLLDEVAAGRRPPSCPREEAYQRFLADGIAVDREDFVLSRALWLVEQAMLEAEEDPEAEPGLASGGEARDRTASPRSP